MAPAPAGGAPSRAARRPILFSPPPQQQQQRAARLHCAVHDEETGDDKLCSHPWILM
jgi:hypothetical protein